MKRLNSVATTVGMGDKDKGGASSPTNRATSTPLTRIQSHRRLKSATPGTPSSSGPGPSFSALEAKFQIAFTPIPGSLVEAGKKPSMSDGTERNANEDSTASAKGITRPRTALGSASFSVELGKQVSAQRRARRDYVDVMLHHLRENRDLRAAFESHVEEALEEKKQRSMKRQAEALERQKEVAAASLRGRQGLTALLQQTSKTAGFGVLSRFATPIPTIDVNAEGAPSGASHPARSDTPLGSAPRTPSPAAGAGDVGVIVEPRNYLRWNRKVARDPKGTIEKEREEWRQAEAHRRKEVYSLHQELLMEDLIQKERSAARSCPPDEFKNEVNTVLSFRRHLMRSQEKDREVQEELERRHERLKHVQSREKVKLEEAVHSKQTAKSETVSATPTPSQSTPATAALVQVAKEFQNASPLPLPRPMTTESLGPGHRALATNSMRPPSSASSQNPKLGSDAPAAQQKRSSRAHTPASGSDYSHSESEGEEVGRSQSRQSEYRPKATGSERRRRSPSPGSKRVRGPDPLEALLRDYEPQPRGLDRNRDRQWITLVALHRSLQTFDLAARGELTIPTTGPGAAAHRGFGGTHRGGGIVTLLDTDGLQLGDASLTGIPGAKNFNPDQVSDYSLLFARKRPQRPVFTPKDPDAMNRLLRTLQDRTNVIRRLRIWCIDIKRQAIPMVIGLLRYQREQRRTVFMIHRFLKLSKLLKRRLRDLVVRAKNRLDGVGRQFDYYQHERMFFTRAVCADAEREVKKRLTAVAALTAAEAANSAAPPGDSPVRSPTKRPPSTKPSSPGKRLNAGAGTGGASPGAAPSGASPSSLASNGGSGQMRKRPSSPEFAASRQIVSKLIAAQRLQAEPFYGCIPGFAASASGPAAAAFLRLGPDPASARAFALSTLQELKADRCAVKVPPKIRDFLIRFICERERVFFAKSVRDWVEATKEAKLRWEALTHLASIQTGRPITSIQSGQSSGASSPATGPLSLDHPGSPLSISSQPSSPVVGALAPPPPAAAAPRQAQPSLRVRKQLEAFQWPVLHARRSIIPPNEMRFYVSVGYALSLQERRWTLESTRGVDTNSPEHAQQVQAVHRHVCSEKNVLDVIRQQVSNLSLQWRLTGIRDSIIEDSPFPLRLSGDSSSAPKGERR